MKVATWDEPSAIEDYIALAFFWLAAFAQAVERLNRPGFPGGILN